MAARVYELRWKSATTEYNGRARCAARVRLIHSDQDGSLRQPRLQSSTGAALRPLLGRPANRRESRRTATRGQVPVFAEECFCAARERVGLAVLPRTTAIPVVGLAFLGLGHQPRNGSQSYEFVDQRLFGVTPQQSGAGFVGVTAAGAEDCFAVALPVNLVNDTPICPAVGWTWRYSAGNATARPTCW